MSIGINEYSTCIDNRNYSTFIIGNNSVQITIEPTVIYSLQKNKKYVVSILHKIVD